MDTEISEPSKKESLDLRANLLQMRSDRLRELAALASDQSKAQRLLDNINALELILEGLPDSDRDVSKKYSRFKTPIDAMVDYLTEKGRPAPRKEIAQALEEGGFRGGDGGARSNILRSIGQSIKTGKLKELRGLVGLTEWNDDKFGSPLSDIQPGHSASK